MKEVDPVETVLKARRIPGSEYQGEWPWWEGRRWERYLELHAGRSILLDAEKALKTAEQEHWQNQYRFPQYWWTTCAVLERKRQEIERELEEVKR